MLLTETHTQQFVLRLIKLVLKSAISLDITLKKEAGSV